MGTIKANDLVEFVLSESNKAVADYFSSDALILKSPIRFGLDNIVRTEIETLKDGQENTKNLTVLLETTGGFIEVVERIYNVIRKHYEHVNFIVGPIDPQMENENERFVSGLGYLAKFDDLVEKINKAENPENVRAELAYLLKKFDPAELFDLEQARSHSEDLLEEWLSRHKFKDWAVTETSGLPVTDDDRRARASEIAKILGDPQRWHSHGRGIGIKELSSEEIKLKITDFGNIPELNDKVRKYYDLFIDYCDKLGSNDTYSTVIHSRNGIRRA